MKIEVSNGELVDKVTILSIKLKHMKSKEKKLNIRKEFDLLYSQMRSLGIDEDSAEYKALEAVNLSLWRIEDHIRRKESLKEFDDEFIGLARKIYLENDKRSAIKRRINMDTGSHLIEEKEYTAY
jgi:hypothetical protein